MLRQARMGPDIPVAFWALRGGGEHGGNRRESGRRPYPMPEAAPFWPRGIVRATAGAGFTGGERYCGETVEEKTGRGEG